MMLGTLQRWWKAEDELHPDKPELTLAVTRLMVGMMAIDGVMHKDQESEIVRLLGRRFNLSDEESRALMQQASESDYRFKMLVRHLNGAFNIEERTTILQELWQVATIDGELDFREDRFINRLSSLLGVSPDCLCHAKSSLSDLKMNHPVFTG